MKENEEKYFIDTNVLVYAHDSRYPDKQAKAQGIIFDGLRLGVSVTSTQVLSEFFVTITQKIKKPLSLEKAKKEIILLSNMEIVEVDVPVIMKAIEMKQKYKTSYWDSLILSAAQRSGCGRLYSEDFSDNQKYGSVKVLNILK
ncbi:hypothetical protein MNBD_BACTEROID05-1244 [hydrothermal vent metagenome]|uniref:PIN domain-containing protein n=1 Tax=hydrothermal vent metagenome TaxID=652676 RepID=A0A3B0TC62_9ZZZZ